MPLLVLDKPSYDRTPRYYKLLQGDHLLGDHRIDKYLWKASKGSQITRSALIYHEQQIP